MYTEPLVIKITKLFEKNTAFLTTIADDNSIPQNRNIKYMRNITKSKLDLSDPTITRDLLNRYFQSWNDDEEKYCYVMPFFTSWNVASYKTEKCVSELFAQLGEAMLIVTGFEHEPNPSEKHESKKRKISSVDAPSTCHCCKLEIDKYYYNVGEKNYHCSCFKCEKCAKNELMKVIIF